MAKELSLYSKAKQAVAECRSVDEAKDIRNKSMAMRIYAQQAQDMEMELNAIEIRLRAERRLGEIMATLPKPTGGDATRVARGIQAPEQKPTLVQYGVDKDLAKRARKLARMNEERFEEFVYEARTSRRIVPKPKQEPTPHDKAFSSFNISVEIGRLIEFLEGLEPGYAIDFNSVDTEYLLGVISRLEYVIGNFKLRLSGKPKFSVVKKGD